MAAEIDYSHQRVLIIDSSGNFRSVIKSMLETIGFGRITAITMSRAALDVITAERFDVILLGHNLHDRFTGMQLLEEARYRDLIRLSCSWVLMSSDSSQESVLYALEAEPDEVLIKPFTINELRHRLAALFHRHRSLVTIEKAVENKAVNRALRLCDEIADGHPHYQYVQYLKGRLLIELERYEEAEKIFMRCDWQNTQWREGFRLALCRFHQGKFAAAQLQVEQIIERHPLFIPAYDLLSRIQEARQQLDQAAATLVTATRRSPLAMLRHMELGRVASRAQQLALAEQSYRKSIALGETSVLDSPEPYLRLANVQRLQLVEVDSGVQQQQQLHSMESLLSKAERRFEKHPELRVQSRLLRAQTYEDLGQEEIAEELTAEARQLASELPEPIDLQQQTQNLLSPPIPDLPVEQLSDAEAAAAQQSAKVNRMGIRNYLAGKPGPAVRYFGAAFEHDKRNVAAVLNLAQLYLEAARGTPGRSKERLLMHKRYMRLASHMAMNEVQQRKYQHLDEVDTANLKRLPPGPLGELLP